MRSPEFPITKAEIVKCLTDLAAEFLAEGGIGDMRPSLLRLAADIIQKQPFETADDLAPSPARDVLAGTPRSDA
jgi:hypothetical protein